MLILQEGNLRSASFDYLTNGNECLKAKFDALSQCIISFLIMNFLGLSYEILGAYFIYHKVPLSTGKH